MRRRCGAADLLGRAEATLREQGRLGLLSHVLSMQVMIHLVLGDLARAGAAAAEGERLAVETEQPVWWTGALVCQSALRAFSGNAAAALRLAQEAELEATRRNLNDLLSCLQLARGAVWALRGTDGRGLSGAARRLRPGRSELPPPANGSHR